MSASPSTTAPLDPLAADLARLLADEPLGLPCDTLASALRRRRADVLAALRADSRFERHGRTRGSRWRLAEPASRRRDGMRRASKGDRDRLVALLEEALREARAA